MLQQHLSSSALSECTFNPFPCSRNSLNATSASDIAGATQLVAIYQASQAIYDLFDKAIVLYEGRQIYFGPADEARSYFERMGWYCPARQTTGDFLTSVTNPQERKAREGFEDKVPRTPEEFEKYWVDSPEYREASKEITDAEKDDSDGAGTLEMFRESHHQMQAKHVRPKSPYVVSIPMQVRLCAKRYYRRLWNDRASTITTVLGQTIQVSLVTLLDMQRKLTNSQALIIGSIVSLPITSVLLVARLRSFLPL